MHASFYFLPEIYSYILMCTEQLHLYVHWCRSIYILGNLFFERQCSYYFNPQCNVTVIHQVLYAKCYLIQQANVTTQLLAYIMHKQFFLITLQTSVKISCSIQPNGVVTMVMKLCYSKIIYGHIFAFKSVQLHMYVYKLLQFIAM